MLPAKCRFFFFFVFIIRQAKSRFYKFVYISSLGKIGIDIWTVWNLRKIIIFVYMVDICASDYLIQTIAIDLERSTVENEVMNNSKICSKCLYSSLQYYSDFFIDTRVQFREDIKIEIKKHVQKIELSNGQFSFFWLARAIRWYFTAVWVPWNYQGTRFATRLPSSRLNISASADVVEASTWV